MTISQCSQILNLSSTARSTTDLRRLQIVRLHFRPASGVSWSSILGGAVDLQPTCVGLPSSAVPANRLPTSSGCCILRFRFRTQPPTRADGCILQLRFRTNFQLFIEPLTFQLTVRSTSGSRRRSIVQSCLRTDLQLASAIASSGFTFEPTPDLRRVSRPPALPSNQRPTLHRISRL